MKGSTLMELPSGKNSLLNTFKKAFLPILTLGLLITIPLYLNNISPPFFHYLVINSNGSSTPPPKINLAPAPSPLQSPLLNGHCNIFRGNWIPYLKEPYYTNETKCLIDDRQNCMKFGRPDNEFIKWRWKPDECELPLFDAVKFLEVVRGKTLAFVGDSVGRNQMQSLVCLLATAVYPVDVTKTSDARFRRWLYPNYNVTIAAFWSPQLVKAVDADPNGFSRDSLMNLYLDEADEAWSNEIENTDIVIISAGQWFYRPFVYFEKGEVGGCFKCNKNSTTAISMFYGYRMAFRTAFKTILSKKLSTNVGSARGPGLVFLRTFSPDHFENGDWNKGGNCARTRPFTKEEMKLSGYNLQFYLTQVEELKAAEREGKEKGLKFRLLDITEAMVLRPDGHPNQYGHWPQQNKTLADCVHWCMPGPVDTWNEFLLQILKMEEQN